MDKDSLDAVDRIVEQWREERPDLDPSGKAITGRIVRLANLLQRRFSAAFDELGLSDGDYGLLVPLRRAGAPHELTPTALARTRMITSGGLTPALDRLEKRGWIERRPNPADRRGSRRCWPARTTCRPPSSASRTEVTKSVNAGDSGSMQ